MKQLANIKLNNCNHIEEGGGRGKAGRRVYCCVVLAAMQMRRRLFGEVRTRPGSPPGT